MIKIVTDTAADITQTQAQAMDVTVVSLGILFGDVPYYQLQDENFELFYRLLESAKNLPVTSQPAPDAFLNEYKEAKENGDDVIVITISGQLSGTIQSANIAKEISGYDKIHIIDSKQAAIGQRLLVEQAVKLRDEGMLAADIANELENMAQRVVLFAALDTLKYLRKGGRIPKSAELLGTVMGIKPLITLVDGAIVMAGKARGGAGALASMVRLVTESGRIDNACSVYFGYTGDDGHCLRFRKLIIAKLKSKNTKIFPVGGTIGTHVGTGAFAIAFLKK